MTGPAVPGTGPPTIALVQPITGVVQHYAWGDPEFIPRLLAATGALAGPEDYFLRRFAFEHFPRGLGFEGFGAFGSAM